jgi:hypothetical protein
VRIVAESLVKDWTVILSFGIFVKFKLEERLGVDGLDIK